MKYTKGEYGRYQEEMIKKGLTPISFKVWKLVQPIANSVIGKGNKLIKKVTL